MTEVPPPGSSRSGPHSPSEPPSEFLTLSPTAFAIVMNTYAHKRFDVDEADAWFALDIPAAAARAWTDDGWSAASVRELIEVLGRTPSDRPRDPACPVWAWSRVPVADADRSATRPRFALLALRAGLEARQAIELAPRSDDPGITSGLLTMGALRAL